MNNPIEKDFFELPADGWFHLAPRGEHLHPATGVTQVIDDTALQAICENFQAATSMPGFSGALIDYDHFSYDPRCASEAAGWIVALKAETGPVPQPGLWARIRWTSEGRASVEAGRYRFLSPVWLTGDCEKLDAADRKRMRPLRLDSAGLTNNPNLKDLAPLSNRNSHFENPFLPNVSINNKNKDSMKNIHQALGLSPEAAEEQAVTEIVQLKNRATAAESRIRALTEENQSLAALRADADLERFQNRFSPAARDKWRAALLANRQATLELLESLPVPASLPNTMAPQHLRAATKTPDTRPLANRAAEQRQAVLEYKSRHQCGWQQAWDALRSQTPELFNGQP
jgi:phage I-like protein